MEIRGVLCLEYREGFEDGWFLLLGLYKMFVGDVGFILLEICVGFWWLGCVVWGVLVVYCFGVSFWFLVLLILV